MSFTTILTAPQAGMSISGLPVTSGTWWSLLSEQDRLQCVDQGESWTLKRRRPWGNKTAWTPAGRVLERWTTEIYNTIKMIINDPGNYNKIYGDESHHPGLGRHLWMVADKDVYQEAHPTIVIACKNKRFAKNTVQLLQEMDSFKRLNLGFKFLAHHSGIQCKAASGGLYPQPEFLPSLCGIEVLLPSVENSSNAPPSQWPRATIGGVLKLGKTCYALTVAHVLYTCNGETDDETASWSGSESEYDSEEPDSSHQNDHSCASGEAVASDELRERDGRASPSTDDPPLRSIIYPAFVDIRPREVAPATRLDSSESPKGPSYVNLGCIGHVYSTVQPHSDSSVNPSYDCSIAVCREWDWALVKIIDPRFCRPNEIRHPAGHTLVPKSISPKCSPPKGNVLAAAGASGIYESNCTGILCGLTLPGTALMVDAWVINSDSEHGDSGGWILDPKNGDIHAIIVATSSNPRFTYVIPAEDIFYSIMGRCGTGMTLDSIDDILLTKISATELDASFSASFDDGGSLSAASFDSEGILSAAYFGGGGSLSVASFDDGESLNAASLFSSQGSRLSLDTRPSTPAFSVISSEPRKSRPEILQAAPFTLFPRENDSEIMYAPSPIGRVNHLELQSGSTSARRPSRDPAGTYHRNVLHGKAQLIEPDVTEQEGSGISPQAGTRLPTKAPNRPNPGKATQTSSLLSEYGQRFIQIPEGDYGSCQTFMASYPGIRRENPNDYVTEALRLQSDGRTSDARSCVQQCLLLRKVSKMSEGESQIFLSKMKSRDQTTLSAFLADFGVVLDAVQKQAGTTQSNLPQPLDKPHRSEQVISEDRRQNQISANLRHAPDPSRHTNVDEGLPASVDRLNLSTPNTVRNHGAGGNGTRPPPVIYRSSTGRRTLTSVDENPRANLSTSNPPQGGTTSVIGDNYDIRGVGEGKEELDHRYYVRPDGVKFFKVGRVFAILWHEGAGEPKGDHMSNKEQFRPIRAGKYGERVFSHILRMVVVRERQGYCWCIPIHTYNGRGVLKPGFNRQDQEAHAIIHMDDTEPGSNSREERMAMTKEPIAVHAASRDQKLDVMSRLNFGAPYSIQMNVKVMNVGKVTDASMPAFESYWRNMASGT